MRQRKRKPTAPIFAALLIAALAATNALQFDKNQDLKNKLAAQAMPEAERARAARSPNPGTQPTTAQAAPAPRRTPPPAAPSAYYTAPTGRPNDDYLTKLRERRQNCADWKARQAASLTHDATIDTQAISEVRRWCVE